MSYKIHLDSCIPLVIIAESKPTNIKHAQKSSLHYHSQFLVDICFIDIKRTNDNIHWPRIKMIFWWFTVKYRNITVGFCLNFFFMLPLKWHKSVSLPFLPHCVVPLQQLMVQMYNSRSESGHKFHLFLTDAYFAIQLPSTCTFFMSCLFSDMEIC